MVFLLHVLCEQINVILKSGEAPIPSNRPSVCHAGDEGIDDRIETEHRKENQTWKSECKSVTGLFSFDAVGLDFSFHGKVLKLLKNKNGWAT